MALPELVHGHNVRAVCPECKAPTTFEWKTGGTEHGKIVGGRGTYAARMDATSDITTFDRRTFRLLMCAACGRGGLSCEYWTQHEDQCYLAYFLPTGISAAPLPANTPRPLVTEFREAERCAAANAWRASSAMLRSVLEKCLKLNGYTKGNLAEKIDKAASDGVITESRKRRAHDEIRSLGNDILHDEWREVDVTEFQLAHLYAQRILEDLYDDRESVEATLTACGRTFASVLEPPNT
jgi:hypothetical protein